MPSVVAFLSFSLGVVSGLPVLSLLFFFPINGTIGLLVSPAATGSVFPMAGCRVGSLVLRGSTVGFCLQGREESSLGSLVAAVRAFLRLTFAMLVNILAGLVGCFVLPHVGLRRLSPLRRFRTLASFGVRFLMIGL